MQEKFFGKHPNIISLPNLIEVQLNSYKWFRQTGLKELFEEVSPIRDWSGKELELYFTDYYFDEPKYNETEAKRQNVSYEAPLRAKLRLVNKKTGEVKEQEIYLGEFPLMTERGTFIVNGVERVVVSQLIRSSGVFFTADNVRGRKLFGAKIIPNRGAWLEFETDMDNAIFVKIDRKRKVPVTALLRAFGLSSDDDIRRALGSDEYRLKEKQVLEELKRNRDFLSELEKKSKEITYFIEKALPELIQKIKNSLPSDETIIYPPGFLQNFKLLSKVYGSGSKKFEKNKFGYEFPKYWHDFHLFRVSKKWSNSEVKNQNVAEFFNNEKENLYDRVKEVDKSYKDFENEIYGKFKESKYDELLRKDNRLETVVGNLKELFKQKDVFEEIAIWNSSEEIMEKINQIEEIMSSRDSIINSEIKKRIGESDDDYIEATIKKDVARNQGEGFIEVYKRLRPGDLATVENARQMIEAMFFDFERYDLAKVGRWKFNLRLGMNTPLTKECRILRPEDLAAVIKEIIRLNNNPDAQADDIDHLANRRVRALGELLQNKLRVGMARMERIIKDRMTTLDIATITPAQLANIRPFMAAIKEFFTTSQLSQFMDQVNPLAELEHKRRISAMGPGGLTRERAGFEVRDVHTTYYGRICPIQTPEGPNIGLIGTLASFARVNEFGFLETPYRKIKNGKASNEIIYMNAFEEQKHDIAHAGVPLSKDGTFAEELVQARVHGQASVTKRARIDFMDVSPQQFISIATSLIPFLEHDDATRALMGSNMQRQSVSCIKPEAPLVGTGVETKSALDSGQVILAQEDGQITEVDADRVVVKNKSGKLNVYPLQTFSRTNQFTSINQHPSVRKGQAVKRGDILANGAAIDNGKLALGQNLLVAFLSWRGANFEDAIIISEKVIRDDRYTSVHIEDFSCDVRETKLGPEITTPDIPNVGEERLKDLDEEGIVRIGAEVGPNNILVGKISPKGEADLTAEERLLRAIFGDKARDVKDTSLRMPYGKRGRIIGIKVFSREKGDKLPAGVIKTIQVEVAQLRKVMVGDKLAGRHGNKGVISKVLPVEEMPYLADGTAVDIILNPLGVASRMNIGQILETHLGLAAKILGYLAVSPSLDGAKEEDIKNELKKAGFAEDGKMVLYDGQTGQPFNQRVTVGYIYMMKLHHLVEDKIHMRSIGPYSLITQQPLGGKAQFGGQRFGEMEVWALEGYGAAHTLQEMLTIKSDDVLGRANAYDAIIRGLPIKAPHVPASFSVLVSELKALGLGVELIGVKEEGEERKDDTDSQKI
ncbi:MAG: DNA-directed RNA polymerase subunit beta [Parcubacteria group bacterium LiPW_39]|nr:MAG: DNA-directed RNA polymerase subunit beta [Parcubacteria group bacterium LiPW_39]